MSALAEAATEADGVRPLSEHVMLHLRYGGDQRVRNVLVWQGPRLVAYGAPRRHRRGRRSERRARWCTRRTGGTGLGRPLVARTARRDAGRPAAAVGARRAPGGGRAGHRPRLPPVTGAVADAPVPVRRPAAGRRAAGVTVRTFEPGRDDEAWVALNAAAFADHPEQGGWTVDDLHRRVAEPWFDPARVLPRRAGRPAGRLPLDQGARRHAGPTTATTRSVRSTCSGRPGERGTGLGGR